MQTIYEHPWLTTWFIMSIGFWVTVAVHFNQDSKYKGE